MRNYLVIDSNQERAINTIIKINKPKEMENFVEYKEEAIIFYDNKKYFFTHQVPNFIDGLSIHGVYLHGEDKLTQEEEQKLRNAMIRTYGLAGVDPDFEHIHRY